MLSLTFFYKHTGRFKTKGPAELGVQGVLFKKTALTISYFQMVGIMSYDITMKEKKKSFLPQMKAFDRQMLDYTAIPYRASIGPEQVFPV